MKILATLEDVGRWTLVGLIKEELTMQEKYRLAFILSKVYNFIQENKENLSKEIIEYLIPFAARIFYEDTSISNVDCHKIVDCLKKTVPMSSVHLNLEIESEALDKAVSLYLGRKSA